ncbi:hypothetical protein GWE18_24310 [Bradyrhizobium sp. CSA112]|uniref:hypothetical protein n=1 Tax=Bradyrhizobium sp. CSA112 TaxID=2699170 RepID=UPI0023B0AFFE|nr:hypothetical protein [Bradyrhizobium sp. CSA112]MDE5455904.1 hypothetical protein [Bradyrhizobium sp. CSA112]
MRAELISVCQLFLVPSAIMFAALGVAGSEGLKIVICGMGAVTSDIWAWTVYHWKDVTTGAGLAPSNTEPVLVLSILFVLAWTVCFWVHVGYGLAYGFERQKEAQSVKIARRPKVHFAPPRTTMRSGHRLRRFWHRLWLPVRAWLSGGKWLSRQPSL